MTNIVVSKEVLANRIRKVGEMLIKNADSIVGNEKELIDMSIWISIDPTIDDMKFDITKNYSVK